MLVLNIFHSALVPSSLQSELSLFSHHPLTVSPQLRGMIVDRDATACADQELLHRAQDKSTGHEMNL